MLQAEPVSTNHRARNWVFFGCAIAGGLALVPLYYFNPIEHGYYPKCLLHSLTGLDCPGCGGLRATHQLLHGNVFAALKLNPLFVCLLPIGAFFAVRHLILLSTGQVLPQPFKSTGWIWLLAIIVIAFGVLRNLPWCAWLGS